MTIKSLICISGLKFDIPRGAGSEAWNRVYLIAPVKKFGRVGLSTNFSSKQTWRWRGRRICRISLYLANVCLCRFSIILALPSLNIQGKVSIAFFTFWISFFLPFLLFLLLILQRVLKPFLTHFTAARFAFLLN